MVELRAAPRLSLAQYYVLWPHFSAATSREDEYDHVVFAAGAATGDGNNNDNNNNGPVSTSALFELAVAPTLAMLTQLPVMRVRRPGGEEGGSSGLSLVQAYAFGGDGVGFGLRRSASLDEKLADAPVVSSELASPRMSTRGFGMLADSEWRTMHRAWFSSGVDCPDLPLLVTSSSSSSSVVSSEGKGQHNGGAPVGVERGEAREARVAWFLLVLRHEATSLLPVR